MGLFKNKKPRENNEINNNQLKESIANIALSQLCQGEDYDSLENTKVEFGYLYDIQNHGIESLFKVITDKNTLYFAVQGEELLRLELDEALFAAYVDSFNDLRK